MKLKVVYCSLVLMLTCLFSTIGFCLPCKRGTCNIGDLCSDVCIGQPTPHHCYRGKVNGCQGICTYTEKGREFACINGRLATLRAATL